MYYHFSFNQQYFLMKNQYYFYIIAKFILYKNTGHHDIENSLISQF